MQTAQSTLTTSTPIRTTTPTPRPAPAAPEWTHWPASSATSSPTFVASNDVVIARRSNLSAQNPDLFALDQVEIDVGAEAGFGRGVDETVAVEDDVVDEAVFLHGVRQ